MSTTRIPRFERGRSAHGDLRGGGRLNKRKRPKNAATHGTGDDDTRMQKKGEGARADMKGEARYHTGWLKVRLEMRWFPRLK